MVERQHQFELVDHSHTNKNNQIFKFPFNIYRRIPFHLIQLHVVMNQHRQNPHMQNLLIKNQSSINNPKIKKTINLEIDQFDDRVQAEPV